MRSLPWREAGNNLRLPNCSRRFGENPIFTISTIRRLPQEIRFDSKTTVIQRIIYIRHILLLLLLWHDLVYNLNQGRLNTLKGTMGQYWYV